MQYYDFNGFQLSALGFGAMRLPVIDGDDARVDEPLTLQMVEYAYDHGINYYDTAWGYHGGNSERVLGRALARYPRESFYLADKFPGYDVSNFGKHEQIFAEQLERCGVDYFDFYLMHNVCELNIEQYLDDEKFGTLSFFRRQVEEGRIKHLGFSVHGNLETFMRFLEAYGDIVEFCQIQLNYMDWDFQNARGKVEELRRRGLAIMVMEPLRGGILISLDDEDMRPLRALRPDANAIEWAFAYVRGIQGVGTVLSGMSNMEQLRENVALFEREDELSADEEAALLALGRKLASAKGVPCTACHYCVSHCPIELDIPRLLELYNEHLSRPDFAFIAPMALGAMPADKHPSACIGCGACASVCPQQIDIPEALADFARLMGE
ncbi:MAG: aldo/keto reductase [Eggerthellaceae bacterium]|nr:aldo/keto reductase [Eggerthellaceae bacterium]